MSKRLSSSCRNLNYKGDTQVENSYETVHIDKSDVPDLPALLKKHPITIKEHSHLLKVQIPTLLISKNSNL